MTTVVLKIPDKKKVYFLNYFKKHRLRMHILRAKEDEDLIAKWIDEGMKSEEVPEEEIFEIFRKHGIKV